MYQLGKANEHIESLERRLFGGPLINGGGRGEKDRDSDSGSGNEIEKIKACLFQVNFARIPLYQLMMITFFFILFKLVQSKTEHSPQKYQTMQEGC